jgi:nucleotide-binding universal stress UspA family protein
MVTMFARILGCVDPSPTGQHACLAAIEMAARFGCRLTLVTVLPGTGKDSQPDLERLVPMDSLDRPIPRIMEDAQAEAQRKGVPSTEVVYLRGKVVESVLEYVERAPPDLLVVGTRGLSRGSRLLLGSVSSRLVSEAPCPVLVVRSVRGRVGRPSQDGLPSVVPRHDPPDA